MHLASQPVLRLDISPWDLVGLYSDHFFQFCPCFWLFWKQFFQDRFLIWPSPILYPSVRCHLKSNQGEELRHWAQWGEGRVCSEVCGVHCCISLTNQFSLLVSKEWAKSEPPEVTDQSVYQTIQRWESFFLSQQPSHSLRCSLMCYVSARAGFAAVINNPQTLVGLLHRFCSQSHCKSIEGWAGALPFWASWGLRLFTTAGGRERGERCIIPDPSRASYMLPFCSHFMDQSELHDLSQLPSSWGSITLARVWRRAAPPVSSQNNFCAY